MSSWIFDPARREERRDTVDTERGERRRVGYATSLDEVVPEEKKKKKGRKGCWWPRWFKGGSTDSSSDSDSDSDSRRSSRQEKEEKDSSKKGWKPLSMSIPILSAMIVLSLLLAATVETLVQRSAAAGGLALSPSFDDIPRYAMVGYLYGPNIVAVLYSLIWSWIDLDVKRLQPWFELSKPEGATAANSLFLDYQYDFVAWVPFKAAKRRHWPTFLSGTTMILILWFLTPLQSALLGTGVVTQREPVNITMRSRLEPLFNQKSLLDVEVLSTGYAIGWLQQSFPRFTTSEYALAPYYVSDDPAPEEARSNWTATTTRYSSDLTCWPAEVSRKLPHQDTYYFLDGQGCNASTSISTAANYSMFYLPYYASPFADRALISPACPETSSSVHQFLAIWAQPVPVKGYISPDHRITAIYCRPSYYKQQVIATVEAASLRPNSDSIEVLTEKEELTESEFNSTAFEFLIGNGVPEVILPRDWPFERVIEQHPRIADKNISKPVSNMVGFALAGQDRHVDEYSDPQLLQDIYTAAHKRLFSAAMNRLARNETDFVNRTATSDFPLTGVIVSRSFATAVESLLVIVAIATCCLLWLCRKAPCNLDANPSSITRFVAIFRNSREVLGSFKSVDNANEKMLLNEFRHSQFYLEYDEEQKCARLAIEKLQEDTPRDSRRKSKTQKGYYDPIRPLALRRGSGFAFVLAIIGAIVGLAYLRSAEVAQKGLPRPSENFEVLQLLENYIPTVFATLVEPFWILLNRLLCTLQPFKDLAAGKTKPKRSVDATYTSIPPQLVFFRALKSKHFTLLVVCSIALLANLLAVGLGALFNEKQMTAKYTEVFKPRFTAEFSNSSVYNFGTYLSQLLKTSAQYQDHMHIASANITAGTSLPPWVSKEYFFQPHDLAEPDRGTTTDTYILPIRGFGARANCTALPSSQVPFNITSDEVEINEDGCVDSVEFAKARIREKDTLIPPSGPSAIEYSSTLSPFFPEKSCFRSIILAWGRANRMLDQNSTIDASFAFCEPRFETAMFNVTVDSSGYVLAYSRTTELESTLGYPESEDQANEILLRANSHMVSDSQNFHNDTLTYDWLSYLLVISSGSRDSVDPNAPLPNPRDMLAPMEDIYHRLFAAMLSLNTHLFNNATAEESLMGTRTTLETRIFMDTPSFIISMTVLGLNLAVALLFYARVAVFILPRMPTTIGSILAYVAPSRIVNAEPPPGGQSRTLSFGRYLGSDGETHLGIELDPHVVPIDPSSLREKKSFLARLPLGALRRRNEPHRHGTWL